MKTLVTGATGTVGRHVMRLLTERGDRPRGLIRDPAAHNPAAQDPAAQDPAARGADLVVGDYGDPASLRAALDGVEQLFLTCANHPSQVDWEIAAIDAAVAAGVHRIVKLSALGAEVGTPVAFLVAHGRIEAHLRGTGIAAVLLQPAFSMSNLLSGARGVRQADAFFAPAAGAKISRIDPRDIAAVASAVLGEAGHDGRAYQLTGPEAVTFDDVATHLTLILGRPIAFAPLTDDEAITRFVAAGAPEWFVRNVVRQFALLRQGTQAETRDTVRVLTGRDARSLGEFLHEHGRAFA
jgi:uncharacterized protein YbjT (DUF2867 family)